MDFDPIPFIFKFCMRESFIVTILVLTLLLGLILLSSGMFHLFTCLTSFRGQVLYDKRFWSQTLDFEAFYANILQSDDFFGFTFLRHILSL